MQTEEVWLPVVGLEGRYEISSLGRLKSLARTEVYQRVLNNGRRRSVVRSKREKFLAPSVGSNGYLTVRLKGKTFPVHTIVLTAFVGPRPAGLAGCHGDGDRQNNTAQNLRWDTYAANNVERFAHMAARRAAVTGQQMDEDVLHTAKHHLAARGGR